MLRAFQHARSYFKGSRIYSCQPLPSACKVISLSLIYRTFLSMFQNQIQCLQKYRILTVENDCEDTYLMKGYEEFIESLEFVSDQYSILEQYRRLVKKNCKSPYKMKYSLYGPQSTNYHIINLRNRGDLFERMLPFIENHGLIGFEFMNHCAIREMNQSPIFNNKNFWPEIELRQILSECSEIAKKKNYSLQPLFSYKKEGYIMTFIQIEKGPSCIPSTSANFYGCSNCHYYYIESDTATVSNCPICKSPIIKMDKKIWRNELLNEDMILHYQLYLRQSIYKEILCTEISHLYQHKFPFGIFLSKIKSDLGIIKNITTADIAEFRSQLEYYSFQVSMDSFRSNLIKTDAPMEAVYQIVKQQYMKKNNLKDIPKVEKEYSKNIWNHNNRLEKHLSISKYFRRKAWSEMTNEYNRRNIISRCTFH